MMKIFKYEIPIADKFTLEVHEHFKTLSVQVQNGNVSLGNAALWCLVDPDSKIVQAQFRLYGTGHPIDIGYPYLDYIGTFQLGGFVGHLFRELE